MYYVYIFYFRRQSYFIIGQTEKDIVYWLKRERETARKIMERKPGIIPNSF